MSSDPPSPLGPTRHRAFRVIWPLAIIAWLLGTVVLLGNAFAATLTFFGETATAEEQATSEHYLVAAAWVAVALPLVGLVSAALGRSRPGTWVCALALLVGLGFAGLVVLSVHEHHRHDPQPPRPRVTVCQEHSGGDNRCPGG
ncbi:MAG: hypothetical protein ABWX96_03935 [Propionibacteriaceae bacterium]